MEKQKKNKLASNRKASELNKNKKKYWHKWEKLQHLHTIDVEAPTNKNND